MACMSGAGGEGAEGERQEAADRGRGRLHRHDRDGLRGAGHCCHGAALFTLSCQDVVEDSESGEFCEEFLFFTGSLDRKRRKTFNSFRLQLEAKKQ